MLNRRPNYSIESYQTRDTAKEVYYSAIRRVDYKTIDDRTFCLCQAIFRCDQDAENISDESDDDRSEGSHCFGCFGQGNYGPNCSGPGECPGNQESCNAPHN